MQKLTANQHWQDAKHYLVNAAVNVGVDPGIIAKIAKYESGFNYMARPIRNGKPLSSALGYGQFLRATWAECIRLYGQKHGYNPRNPEIHRYDKEAQALMLAEFTKQNIALGRKYGGDNDDANVYAFHNLGAGDATKILKALKDNPRQMVAKVLSRPVIDVNPDLYGDGSRSLANVYRIMGLRMADGDVFAEEARKMAKELAHD